ncbi:MAG TPA: hypothetical protein PK052_08145 [Anaerohalosphaeraceae bacterium]|nr:hypothetical protein [Anaerohalosphaeraceae bacterium]HOL31939.1 hypothetical protein [Anaerohalosphaeraceae bacterium]HOM75897.1 hypothetical protein [Anaerohalosphaeraceae bacterium]HPC63732.1 hypothetical protein [Anaerohalosphaeraceae bacterium]HPO69034.1 hypothetical protein [Anaerohalosphaeraceae bacterium]
MMTGRKKQYRGFALLVVLIAAAILMLLYFVQIDVFVAPEPKSSQPAAFEQRPWLLEDLLAGPGQSIPMPSPPKAQIDRPFERTAAVSRNQSSRGRITAAFETDGRIVAQWNGTWTEGPTNFQINAVMKGNISVSKTYEDAAGKDKSRLFFIARGQYCKTEEGSVGSVQEEGTAYLLGWLCSDYSAVGCITITTDRKWTAEYRFEWPAEDI